MKRIIISGICLSLILCACSSGEVPSGDASTPAPPNIAALPSSSPTTSLPDDSATLLEQVVDGITYTVTKAELQDVVGDRDAENFGVENGDYFAMGSEIEKVSDWKRLIVHYTITNDTDKAFGYSIVSWTAHLPDGFALEPAASLMDFSLMQVPSHNQEAAEIVYYLKSDLAVSEVQLAYSHLDYNEQYYKDFSKILTGEMAQSEYEKAYTPTELTFTIPIPLN